MSDEPLALHLKRVLYHHRTRGRGVEGIHICGITDALRSEGVAVDLISLPGADPYSNPRGMSPTHRMTRLIKLVSRLPEPLFEMAEIAYNVVVVWRLWRYLASRSDVNFIYERYSMFMFATVWLGRLRGLPVILEVNDSAAVERVRPLFFVGIAMAIERWVFRRASGLVFVSTVFRDRTAAIHGELAPSIVTPNAANISQFSFTAEQRQQARARWDLDGHVVCGYLGAFIPWHAIDQFVYRIAERLVDSPHLKLLLVGDGAKFPEVAYFVKQRGLGRQVILTGRVPHDQVPGLLGAMDMAVLPSAGDYTSPVKLFEFMACGVPPIAPDFLPIREVLKEGETGWMFKAGDLDAAVESVLQHSRDLAGLQAVGRAARHYIATERQWRDNVRQLAGFYLGLVRKGQRESGAAASAQR
jgi:glycosyltransferase involved in cell wall biosynthesis